MTAQQLGHFTKLRRQNNKKKKQNKKKKMIGKLFLFSLYFKRSMQTKSWATFEGLQGTCRHRTYSGTSCSPLKYLSCGRPCSMACTTNWSPLTEVSLWDCYIIAGKWRRTSLFNCDTVNPNLPIIFVAEPPLCSEASPILSKVFHLKRQTLPLFIYIDYRQQIGLNNAF